MANNVWFIANKFLGIGSIDLDTFEISPVFTTGDSVVIEARTIPQLGELLDEIDIPTDYMLGIIAGVLADAGIDQEINESKYMSTLVMAKRNTSIEDKGGNSLAMHGMIS